MDKYTSLCKILLLCCLFAHHEVVTGSVFTERIKPHGLNRYKLWWAKEITPDYYVAGQLTERKIKYASEGGFKSILSLYPYGNRSRFGMEYVPATRESKELSERFGMDFAVVMSPNTHWDSVDTIEKFAHILPRTRKPVLFECHFAYTCTFVLLVHLANLTRHYPLFHPPINSSRLYDISASMGYYFTGNRTHDLVSVITGEAIVHHPPIPNVQPASWLSFWVAHPVYRNWYISGQITMSDVKELVFAGFKSVVNVRTGLFFDGKPNQEEVNLLNIRERTGTYATISHPGRQTMERLEQTRLDPSKPNNYISPDSKTNYDIKNMAEFGDDVGYNEVYEKAYVEGAKIDYYHLPVADNGPWMYYFDSNIDTIVEVGKDEPVLVHSASGKRACYVAILAAAMEHGLDFNWAIEKSRDLGYPIGETTTPDIYKAMKKHLHRRATKTEL